jgi:pyruvate dehydrogenase E1 component alpha subunit
VEDLALMGVSYDIPGKQVDGMDVLTVYEETSEAVRIARAGQPSFLEIKTYRYRGHSMSDPATYRTKDEVNEYKKQDPILVLKDYMEKEGLLKGETYEEMDRDVRKTCDEAVKFAEDSEEPDVKSLYDDVLV